MDGLLLPAAQRVKNPALDVQGVGSDNQWPFSLHDRPHI